MSGAPDTGPTQAGAPLAGVRVVVTRAREQAAGLVSELEALGAHVIAFPVIRFVDPPDFSAVDAAIARLSDYDWVVLTSANGVKHFLARLEGSGDPAELLAGVHIAVVGSATAAFLADEGLTPDLVPEDFRGEGLAAALVERGVGEGSRVLVPRALKGREILPDELRDAGARVDVVPVYQTIAATPEPDIVEALRGGVDAITFTSPSTVRHTLSSLDGAGVDAESVVGAATVVSIGPVTSEALRSRGIAPDVEPTVYTAEAMVAALVDHLRG